MSININDLTHQEKYFLLEFSYIDLPIDINYNLKHLTIDEALKAAMKVDNITSKQKEKMEELKGLYNELLEKNTKLKDLSIIGYENHNPVGNTTHDTKTGFVGYVLEDTRGNRGFLFRGSELESDQKPMVDMGDNLAAAFTGSSAQLKQAVDFFDAYKVEGKTHSLYGHSKGNNLQTEVFLRNLDMDIYAYGINGQPIYFYDLTDEQKQALRGDRYTFIIHEYDVVNMLGYVDYIDQVIKVRDRKAILKNPFYPHSLGSVEFDESGDFAADKPVNTLGRQGINILVTLVHDIEVLTVGRLRNFSSDPFGFNALKQVGKDLYNLTIDTARVLINYVVHNVTEFAVRLKDAWVENAAKLKKWSQEAIQGLKTWLERVIEDAKVYIENVKNTVKEYTLRKVEQVRETWNTLKEKVSTKFTQIKDSMIEKIKQEKDKFIESVKGFKSKLGQWSGKIKAKLVKGVKTLVQAAAGGASGPKIRVNLQQLQGLQKSLQRSEDRIGDIARRVLSLTSRVTSDVGRRYPEYYVQAQLRQLQRITDQIQKESRRVSESLQRNAKGVGHAVAKYKEIESKLRSLLK